MVKNRDIKGALASDHALREVVEKRVLVLIIQSKLVGPLMIRITFFCQVNDNEIVLCDLESRQVSHCIAFVM